MLIPFAHIIETYNPIITGILHVGTGECDEIQEYEKHVSREDILWVNPSSENVVYCRQMYEGINVECINVHEIRDIVYQHNVVCNFMNIDLQGFEKQILDSLGEHLNLIDYVYVEINCTDTMLELDAHMKKYNLVNIETKWWDGGNWADVFYARL